MIDLAVRVVILLTSTALAVFLLWESFFVGIFLPSGGPAAESTAALTLAVAGASGMSLLITLLLVARHLESIAARAFVVGTATTVLAGIAVVAVGVRNEALWMAAALVLGQFVGLLLISRGTIERAPALRRPLAMGVACSAALLAGGILAVAAPETRYYVAVAAAGMGLSLFLIHLRRGVLSTVVHRSPP